MLEETELLLQSPDTSMWYELIYQTDEKRNV